MSGDDALLVYGVAFLAWVAIFGFIGYAVGKSKGRGGLGWALGCLLGIIGVIIIAVLSPTPEHERRRYALITGQDPDRPPTPAGPSPDELRQQAVAEAVRRDPSLASASDPESLQRLAAATAAVVEELRVKAALEAVQLQQREEVATALNEAQTRLDREKAEQARQAESARGAREATVRREEKEQRLQALPPFRRWIARNPYLAAGLVVLLLVAIAVPTVMAINSRSQQRAAEQAAADQAVAQQAADQEAAAAQAAAEEEAAAAENALLAEQAALLNGTAELPTRLAAAEDPSALTPDLMAVLLRDPSSSVRIAMAKRDDLPTSALTVLANDSVVDVRYEVVVNPLTPTVLLRQLASDPYVRIRSRIAGDDRTPIGLLRRLADDPEFVVRLAVALNSRTPESVLRDLRSDPNSLVRASASSR